MKRRHLFSIILLGLIIGSSFIVQNSNQRTNLNQASIVPYTNENSINPFVNEDFENAFNLENSIILPVKRIGSDYLPHLTLPEVTIDGKFLRDNIYSTVLLDGEYIAHIYLKEVKITAI